MSSINITPANGNKNLVAGVYNVVYAAPSGCISATVNARIVSHDLTQNISCTMYIVPNGYIVGSSVVPNDNTLISPKNVVLGPNGVASGIMEDTSIVLAPGETLVVYTDIGFSTSRVHGLVRTIGA